MNVQNFTFLPILTKIKVAKTFAVFIFLFYTKTELCGQTNLCSSEHWYTNGRYFNPFNLEATGMKGKRVTGAQLVYSYILTCLLLAERQVHC
jgi:hypothetical protein